MNNLFSSTKTLYKQAFTKVKSDDIVKSILLATISQITPELIDSEIKIFLSQSAVMCDLSLCSRNNTILSALKMHSFVLETQIKQELFDKNIISFDSKFTLKMYHR
jgi:hypothetical protein